MEEMKDFNVDDLEGSDGDADSDDMTEDIDHKKSQTHYNTTGGG